MRRLAVTQTLVEKTDEKNSQRNNFTELNELINAGEKLVCDKIGIPGKNRKRNTKPMWEMMQEGQIKNFQKRAKLKRNIKHTGTKRKEMITEGQPQTSLISQPNEINQKVLLKEEKLKIYRDSNINKTEHSKINKNNSPNKLVKRTQRQTNNQIQKIQNYF